MVQIAINKTLQIDAPKFNTDEPIVPAMPLRPDVSLDVTVAAVPASDDVDARDALYDSKA